MLGLLAAAASVAVETAYPLGGVGVYLLGVGIVSILWGVRLGATAALVSVLLWDHFQTPHLGIFSFHIRDLLALAMLLAVALLAGSVAELARSRTLEADARRQEPTPAAERRTWPPSWRACCYARRTCARRCRRPHGAWRRPLNCPTL
jgi:K+-sensing histidine kinase KdpD